MENDGSYEKSEELVTEQDTHEAEGDVDLSATLCSQRSLKNVLTTVGNILEWFDFAIYGFFEPELACVFFPENMGVNPHIFTFAIFAGAFMMRISGGLLFGYIGDKFGRKNALFLSILLMAIATTSMGCLPTFALVGFAAPIMLFLVRLCQGLSVGGQLVGTFIVAIENAPPGQEAYYGSIALGTASLGTLLGSVVSVIMKNSLSDENLLLFGWRIPFIVSGLGVGAFFFIFRNKIEHDEPVAKEGENPIKVAIRDYWRKTLLVIFVSATWCSGFYLINVWINAFTTGIKIPVVPHGRVITMVCIFLHVLAFPVFGKLTDYVRTSRKVMLAAAVILAVSAMPMFAILNIGGVDCDINDNKYLQNMTNQSQNEGTCVSNDGNFSQSHCPTSSVSETLSIAATFGSQLFLTVMLAIYGSALPVWMVTSFPPEVRYTAVGLGYNLAQALLGGTAPLIATALIDASHWKVSPSIFLILTSTLSAATLAYLEFGDNFFGKGKSDLKVSYSNITANAEGKTDGSETVEEEPKS